MRDTHYDKEGYVAAKQTFERSGIKMRSASDRRRGVQVFPETLQDFDKVIEVPDKSNIPRFTYSRDRMKNPSKL